MRDCGGVRSVEDIRLRCHVDDETDCWNWRLAFSGRNRCPCVWYPKLGSICQVTRVVLDLKGTPVPTGELAWRTCWNNSCVNPDHMKTGTPEAFGAAIRKSGVQKGLQSKIVANIKIGRARRKITPDMQREIHASNETLAVLAERFNVSTYCISTHRRRIRARGMAGSSVFNLSLKAA